jgi:hypothetical protein
MIPDNIRKEKVLYGGRMSIFYILRDYSPILHFEGLFFISLNFQPATSQRPCEGFTECNIIAVLAIFAAVKSRN